MLHFDKIVVSSDPSCLGIFKVNGKFHTKVSMLIYHAISHEIKRFVDEFL